MGRTKTKKKGVAKPIQEQQEKAPSMSSLIEKAQALVGQCDYDLASRFVHRILERQSNNAEAKELLGVVQLETGDKEAAKMTFTSLLSQSPDQPPPSAHLYLAQLCDDEPCVALQHYQAAIDIMSNQLKGKEIAATEELGSDHDSELRTNIIRALLGQVEIWMDDLCFEPEAESKCEELLRTALQIDPGNAESLQTLASVRLSQQKPDEAKECLEQSWNKWKDLDPDHPNVPPIPSRLALIRLLLEVLLYAPALSVLQGILAIDDEEVEAWYLEGWCYYLMAEQAQENDGKLDDVTSQELAQEACNCLERCRLLHTHQQHHDTSLLEHTKELIVNLESLGIKAVPLDEADDEDEWEEINSSDEDGDVEMS